MNRSLSPSHLIAIVAGLVGLTSPATAQTTRLLGLDISAWQGNIAQTTWNNLCTNENRNFIILRSSRGGTTGYYNQNDSANANGLNTLSQRYDDPYFVQNINRVVAAGMYAGMYHFSRPDIIASTLNSGGIPNNGTDEADHFIQMAGPWMRPGYLLPVHDLEAGDGIRSAQEIAQFCVDFSNRIYERMGIRSAIYINGNYAQNILGGVSTLLRNQLAQPNANPPSMTSPLYPVLWSARWPNQADPNSIDVQNGEPKDSTATIYGPWDDYGTTHPWVFWQYASTLRLNSFQNGGGNLDADVVRGGFEFLRDQLIPAVWTSDTSGNWSTLTNWNCGLTPVAPVTGPGQVTPVGTQTLPTPRLPGAAGSGPASGQFDTVILERPNTNLTVTLSSGTYNLRKLYVRETLDLTGGSLTVNYVPSPDSTTNSARFSAPVSLSGSASFSVHTLQIDSAQTFALNGGSLTLNTVQLMSGSTPGKLALGGNVTLTPWSNVTAAINPAVGSGNSGVVDLTGNTRILTVGNGSADVDLNINVPCTNGGLTKAGAGTLQLSAASTYTGATTVTAGGLLINNRTNSGTGTGTVGIIGGFLGGTGTISGVLTVNSPGTLAPGNLATLGKLSLGSEPILIGTNFLRIDRNGGAPRSDQLALQTGTLNYGGTLVVSNAGPALLGGEVFSLFNAPGYSGAFSATILPSLTPGLNWQLNPLAINGTIRVNRAPTATPDSFIATPTVTLQIPIASLLTNDTDPDGDPITLTGVTLLTTNGVTLSTNATDIFYLTTTSGHDEFSYTLSDGNGGSATGSVQITITVPNNPPTIGQPPLSQTVIAGQPAGFNVSASGSAPLAYQWRFYGTNIAGVTGSSFTIPNSQSQHAGDYSVVVTNAVGSATSSVASLTVNYSLTTAVIGGGTVSPPPNPIGYAPGTAVLLTATPDAGFTFSAWEGDASGAANPLNVILTTNKWITASFLNTNVDVFLDNTNSEASYNGDWQTGTASTDKYLSDYRFASTVAGGTNTVTYRPNLPSAGYYDIFIWYPQGSNRATNSPWTISFAGGTTNIAVDQSGNGGAWRLLAAARPFAAGTNGFIQISNDTGASGKVVMADGVRFKFVGALNTPPGISVPPTNQVVKVGANAVFSISASGNPAPSYQWFFNTAPIPGAISNLYVRANAQLAHAGSYSVIVSNVAGIAETNASLTVLPLAPLWLQSITPLPDGRMELVVTGEPGYPYGIERTTNFATWQQITNLANPTGVSSFIDDHASTNSQGFYRAFQ